MVKKCEVLYYNQNSNILAFRFNEINVQITISKKLDKNVRYVNIKYDNGIYLITDEEELIDVKLLKKKYKTEELEISNDQDR